MSKTLAKSNRMNRKWVLGTLVALTVFGGIAAAGAVSGKPSENASPVAQETHATFENTPFAGRLWIEDITGSGEWIEVESWSWGVTQTGSSSSGGGGGAGKASFQDLHFTTHLSQYSPKIVKFTTTGQHIKRVIFEDFKAAQKGSNETVYLKLTLSDCLISSYQIGGNTGDHSAPSEQVSLNFAKIEFSYNPKNDDRIGTPGSFTYDLKEGKEG